MFLAAATIVIAVILPADLADVLVAALLALAAGVYPGFAMSDHGTRQTMYQWGVALGFVALAVAGIGWWRPLLAVGWILHAGWDYLHHASILKTKIHPRYPMFCLAYDLGLAAFVLAT
jgi:hypothetical protein